MRLDGSWKVWAGRFLAVLALMLLLLPFTAYAGTPELQSGEISRVDEGKIPPIDTWSPEKLEMTEKLCCLDEWQVGSPCGLGQRRAAYCTDACGTCGAYFCVTSTTRCLK